MGSSRAQVFEARRDVMPAATLGGRERRPGEQRDAIGQRGTERVELPPAETWRMLPGLVDHQSVTTLRGLPIVADVHIGDRLRPPYRISVRALRVGTPVIVERQGGRATRLLIGTRSELEHERGERESSRFPIVGLLAAMGVASFVVAYRLSRMS